MSLEPDLLIGEADTAPTKVRKSVSSVELGKRAYSAQHGAIAVVHDLSLAATFADHLVPLCNGEIIMQDQPEQVLQKQQLLPAYGVSGHYFHTNP